VNYTELEELIQDMAQNSETSFVSHINEFIRSAEDKAFTVIEGRNTFKTSAAVTTVAAQHYYGQADGVPDGIADILAVRLVETASGNIETGGPMRYLLVKDYDFLWEAYPGTAAGPNTGVPKHYAVKAAISNSGEANLSLFMFPQPDDAYSMEIEYSGRVSTDSITSGNTPGTISTTTTWMSVVLPDVLLYGALVQGYIYMKGEQDVMALYQKNFEESLIVLKNLTEKRLTTDKYKANDEGTS
jgi:hypothetical protein